MDKNILKKFAIEARRELMEKIANKIKIYYPDEEFNKQQNGDIITLTNQKHTLKLSYADNQKRDVLIKRIKELSLLQVVEEAAYTWFNRIIAIRYMEIHNYLPLTKENSSLGIRILSSKENTLDPEIMKFSNLANTDLDIGLDKEKYSNLKDENEKFKYILLLVCKKLSRVIPQVFGENTDYIDILMPDNLLNKAGFITKLIEEVPEENYEQVEVIGWLYQYYISEKKEEVFADLKKNIKIQKNNIPVATQLFTPDWIVKYMVENSLGRYLTSKENLEFYVELKQEIKENTNMQEITFMDPCCGSGHILLYAFEVFYNEYLKQGFTKEEAVKQILTKHLYGIDLDARAVQLTILTLCLKARSYDKEFFKKNIVRQMNIITIQNSKGIEQEWINYEISEEENRETVNYILEQFEEANEYGSLIKMKIANYKHILDEIENKNFIGKTRLETLVKQAIMLANSYDIVCTNPPYMGKKSMNPKLNTYLSTHYTKTKSDMYAAFIERCNDFTKKGGYQAMITIHTWMFISSYEALRNKLIEEGTIINLLHTGPSTFTELSSFNVLAVAFCLKKEKLDITSTFIRLVDYYDANKKIQNFTNKNNYYYLKQNVLQEIPGSPYIYWISPKIRNAFKNNQTLGKYYMPKQGLATADNNRFTRLWFETNINQIGFSCKSSEEALKTKKKWFPYHKGGDYRKWYGNNEWVVNWENDGQEIKNFTDDGEKIKSRPQNLSYYFKEGITWSLFGFENFGVRYKDYGFIFDVSGSSMFPSKQDIYYVIGYLCSNVAFQFLSLLAPTVNFQVGNIASLPFKRCTDESIDSLVKQNIAICKEEWDMHETSWEFKESPLCQKEFKEPSLEKTVNNYLNYYNNELREKLRQNEEKLNQKYAQIFEMESEIDPRVTDRDLSLKEIDAKKLIQYLLSYAVGCILGRYSLDKQGLVYAGGEFESSNYKTFKPEPEGIIPITEEPYFKNDIVSRLQQWLEIIYGKETINENLEFIAQTLGKKSGESSYETIRRYFIHDFYSEHIKMYQKRPIYWLFDSGKKNGFKCLIYMHRYNVATVSKIRLDYVHQMQNNYEKLLENMNEKLGTELSILEKRETLKRQVELNAKLQEIKEYDEKIAHIAAKKIQINLDDGIMKNYAKFVVTNEKKGKEESILAVIR